MDATLAGLLAAIEAGDFQVIGTLADWLEDHADPRAELARQTLQPDYDAIADELYRIRAGDDIDSTGAALAMGSGFLGIEVAAGLLFGVNILTAGTKHASRVECWRDVEASFAAKKFPGDVIRAITAVRRVKVGRLLGEFEGA